jgi:hypothetical protein
MGRSQRHSPDSPFINYDTMIQVNDNFVWTRGRHNIKFGGELTRTRFNQLGGVTTRGRFVVIGQYSSSGVSGQPIVAAHNIADWMQGLFSISESQDGVPIANYRNWYTALGQPDLSHVRARHGRPERRKSLLPDAVFNPLCARRPVWQGRAEKPTRQFWAAGRRRLQHYAENRVPKRGGHLLRPGDSEQEF